MASNISKTDYLKKYLGKNNENKKKKRKEKESNVKVSRLKIVDIDIDLKNIPIGQKEEEIGDEAPLVVLIKDDRPQEVQMRELFGSKLWKKVGNDTLSDISGSNEKARDSLQMKSENKKPKRLKIRHDSDSDLSPERIRKGDYSSRSKPLKKARCNSSSDLSPERIRKSEDSSNSKLLKRSRRDSDSDLSPERIRKSDDSSRSKPLKRTSHNNRASDGDLSPPRRRRRHYSSGDNVSKNGSDSDLSPPRAKSHSSSRDADESPEKGDKRRPSKTLSGLSAGLQNATTLRKEANELRERERKHITELGEKVGKGAETIVRDRKTGHKRDLAEEERLKEEKQKEQDKKLEKYAQWGKGVEQTDEKKNKLSDDLYEASKPLARYRDDEDLEARLKSIIYDEDPMSAYMRKKQKKGKPNEPELPAYNGPAPHPNRYGILPGYRWDGLDRSNGFEKKIFEKVNSSKASEEEAYLWSIQDM